MCTDAVRAGDDGRLLHGLSRLGAPASVRLLVLHAVGSRASGSVAARLHIWFLLSSNVGARTPWSCARLVARTLGHATLLMLGVVWVCERVGKGCF